MGPSAVRHRPRRLVPLAFVLVLVLCARMAAAGPVSSADVAPAAPFASSAVPAGPHEVLDRATPRRAIQGFLHEAKGGNFALAAEYLDTRALPPAVVATEGPIRAQELAYALQHRRSLDYGHIPDDAEGDPQSKPPLTFVVETFYIGEEPAAVTLARVHLPDGVDRWLIAPSTVAAIPAIAAAYGPRPIGVPIPRSLMRPTILGNEPWQWLGLLFAILSGIVLARVLAAIVVRVAASISTGLMRQEARDAVTESARRPLRMVLGALVFRALLDPFQLTTSVLDVGRHVTFTLIVVGVAWLVIRALGEGTRWLDEQADRDGGNGVRGRSMRTQVMLLHRVASVTIIFFASAVVLIQFDFVRNVGVSLLASAGVASVVVGLAAQKSLSAIIGGIQFSAAQPVRMGDQVVVESEFGEVEEINLTYAVIRLWDKRRLILPITYFLEKPFQNWTRSATDLMGTVLLQVDFGVPVDRVREELRRICESDPKWDKRKCTLQVTDSSATSATLRALVSASDADRLWDLRCNVRERLIAFVQSLEGGKYLARTRHVVDAPATPRAE
ncbi:MAG TPA: mechanosensitive ion channel domain-containing protein [Polyangiaceae bacterium]|nr:mechanosensitive ion channel domain-containing protein [Polyangiaceae bacterium]